ncbi:MAG: helix-hairpin-helix domain-containing protein, partial [Nanoarchaeota archaeon]
EKFDSLKTLSNASIEDLQTIPLIGEKKARRIHDVLNASYDDLLRS